MSIEERVWKTKDGREIHLERMETTHIYNTILLLRRENFGPHSCPSDPNEPCAACHTMQERGASNNAWIRAFQVELLRRGEPTEPDLKKLDAANKAWEAAIAANDLEAGELGS